MSDLESPIIIIGAPRSGTNMLRDALTRLPGMATWPCDEINYIWRHGNVRYPSDELTPEMATCYVRRFIRQQFDWVRRTYDASVVVEKTCANSLRVDFVERVVPEARYIYIQRDCVDAIGSALVKWKEGEDIRYLLKKARFVPISDFPYYALRHLSNRFGAFARKDQKVERWGPRLNGMNELLTSRAPEEVCAVQWYRCVESAKQVLSLLPRNKWVEIDYEVFVRTPREGLQRVTDFLGLDIDAGARNQAVADVHPGSIGRGRVTLSGNQVRRVSNAIKKLREEPPKYM